MKFRDFRPIVREFLGREATEQDVRLCQMSIRAQCFGPLLRERRRKMSMEGPKLPGLEPILDEVEILADHVTHFSLAGIQEVRNRIAARGHAGNEGVAEPVPAMQGERS